MEVGAVGKGKGKGKDKRKSKGKGKTKLKYDRDGKGKGYNSKKFQGECREKKVRASPRTRVPQPLPHQVEQELRHFSKQVAHSHSSTFSWAGLMIPMSMAVNL